jgi:hypothetical protein
LPLTVAVPTTVPPLVHTPGALDCGPNTVNVIVPPTAGLVVPPDNTELIEPAAIAAPAVPAPGPLAVAAVVFLTTVSVADGQALFAVLLLKSPP